MLSVFQRNIAERRDEPALFFVRNGQAASCSWGALGDEVHRWAAALERMGVAAGDRVVQWSANRREWVITDLALQVLRAIHVPLHASLSGSQAVEQMLHCGAAMVILEGMEQWSQLLPHRPQLPEKLTLVTYDPLQRRVPHERLQDWTSQMSPQRGLELTRQALRDVDPHEIMTVLYTSGTTGRPKGIALFVPEHLFQCSDGGAILWHAARRNEGLLLAVQSHFWSNL